MTGIGKFPVLRYRQSVCSRHDIHPSALQTLSTPFFSPNDHLFSPSVPIISSSQSIRSSPFLINGIVDVYVVPPVNPPSILGKYKIGTGRFIARIVMERISDLLDCWGRDEGGWSMGRRGKRMRECVVGQGNGNGNGREPDSHGIENFSIA